MNNINRAVLAKVVGLMLLVLVIGFLFILFNSLNTKTNTTQPKLPNSAFSQLKPGDTVLARHKGQRVWVSNISATQLLSLQDLTPFVKKESACDLLQSLCGLKAKSLRDGVELVYQTQKPDHLSEELSWPGGFIDPATGLVYDLIGRRLNKQPLRSNDKGLKQLELSFQQRVER